MKSKKKFGLLFPFFEEGTCTVVIWQSSTMPNVAKSSKALWTYEEYLFWVKSVFDAIWIVMNFKDKDN